MCDLTIRFLPTNLRAAWEEVLSGILQHHIRDAIWFECVRRGIEPREVITDPPRLKLSSAFEFSASCLFHNGQRGL